MKKKKHEKTPPETSLYYAATGSSGLGITQEDPRAPRKGPTESKRPLREVPAAATCTKWALHCGLRHLLPVIIHSSDMFR